MSDLSFLVALVARASEGSQSGTGAFGLGSAAEGTEFRDTITPQILGTAPTTVGERCLFGFAMPGRPEKHLVDFIDFAAAAGQYLAECPPPWGGIGTTKGNPAMRWVAALFWLAPRRTAHVARLANGVQLIPEPWQASLAALDDWRQAWVQIPVGGGVLVREDGTTFPFDRLESTAEAGKPRRYKLSGTMPLERLPDLERFADDISRSQPLSEEAAKTACRFSIVGKSIFLDGRPVAVEATDESLPALLVFLADLISHPGVWRSGSEIQDSAPVEVNFDRRYIYRYKAYLPGSICTELIESDRRKGHRLTSTAWRVPDR